MDMGLLKIINDIIKISHTGALECVSEDLEGLTDIKRNINVKIRNLPIFFRKIRDKIK